jgi:hypothetical protein
MDVEVPAGIEVGDLLFQFDVAEKESSVVLGSERPFAVDGIVQEEGVCTAGAPTGLGRQGVCGRP